VHPGPQISLGVVCALTGLDAWQARQVVDVLVGAHLLEQTGPGWFQFHDLLRAYATDQARLEDSLETRAAALRRVLDWYLHSADAAQSLIQPAEEHVALDPPDDAVTPLSFAGYDQAVDWAEHEHANFLPVVRAAEQAGLDRQAWQLTLVHWYAKAPSSDISDWMSMAQIGLRAVRRVGERAGEAALLECLGMGYARLHRLADSIECHQQALTIRRERGDRYGEASSLNLLGVIHLRRRQLDEAKARFDEAQAIFQSLGATHWQAVALANRGMVHHEAQRLNEAAQDTSRAMAVHREQEDKRDLGNALRLLSAIHLDRGEPHEALAAANEAVKLALELRYHAGEGFWLLALGNAQQELGQFDAALTSYQRSAVLHRRLGYRGREALAWQGAGQTYQRLGRSEEAAAFHRQAAAVHHALGDPWNEALALADLADALSAADPDQARRHRREALRLVADYRDPRAAGLRQRIGEGRDGTPRAHDGTPGSTSQ
jgi:tetratricopeptide (TPR) repeat protein